MTTPNDLPSVGTEDYTEGRMTWRSRPDGSLIYIIGDPKVGAHAQGDIYINEADLRRISACWNACVGIADPENFVGRLLVLNEKTPKAESDLATIRSERDELTRRVRELERHNKALVERREWDVKDIKEYSAMVGRLEGVVSEFLEMVVSEFLEMVEEPPESNCSCHISPPCNDCVNHSGARSAFAAARAALNASKEHP